MSALNYKAAGVDIDVGDSASRIMYEASRRTWDYRRDLPGFVETPAEFFAGVRSVDAGRFANALVGLNFDGVGTKIEIAERMRYHATIAHDLFAMVCDDAAVRGAEPALFGSILDCSRISLDVVKQLASGMIEAAKRSRVAVMNGEIAELGGRVQGFGPNAYNWGGAVFWIARRDRLLSGNRIRTGHAIIAAMERGFRSNGISLVRKVFSETYGQNWHNHSFKRKPLGTWVLEPSIIYTRLLVDLTGGYSGEPTGDITGAAHVTGGGVPGKLARLLYATGLGATLDNLYEPAEIMRFVQQKCEINDREAYRTWNMGQGLLIVTPNEKTVLGRAKELGFRATKVGEITKEKGIRILSRGVSEPGAWLNFGLER